MPFHDLCHTCAPLLVAQRGHSELVMEILGDGQIAVMKNISSHVIHAMQCEIASQIGAILNPWLKRSLPRRLRS